MTHKFAKFLALATAALGLSALPALADSPCPTTDLQTYLNDYNTVTNVGCTVTFGGATLDFTDFTYTPGGSTMIAASSIGVSEAPPPNGDGPGLNFNPSSTITSGTEDIQVGFTVTALGGAEIGDVFIALTNVLDQGTATTSYTEHICNGPSTVCTVFVEDPVTNGTAVVNLSNTALGGAQTSLSITKDVQMSAGSAGTAFLSGFQNEYSTVPEPRAISLLLGLGLLAGFAIFKRRQATQS